jgi:hypothetical protein
MQRLLRRWAAPWQLVSVAWMGVSVVTPLEEREVLVAIVDQRGHAVESISAGDLSLRNAGASCDVIRVVHAAYPLAVVIDTSSYARAEFRELQAAAQRFVTALRPRPLAVYASGAPGGRVQEFTDDRNSIAQGLSSVAAAPNAGAATLETIRRASTDLARLKTPVGALVVVSAGGTETSPPTMQEVWSALSSSSTILNVIDERSNRISRGQPQENQGDALEVLARRSHGKYIRGTSAAVYDSGLQAIRDALDSQFVVRYAVRAGAPHDLNILVKPTELVVMAIDLDR